jgi:outer membrane immunogenic protein
LSLVPWRQIKPLQPEIKLSPARIQVRSKQQNPVWPNVVVGDGDHLHAPAGVLTHPDREQLFKGESKMKFAKLAIGVAASVGLLCAATVASADGPRYGIKDAAPDDRPFSWTGFYVGGAVGYGAGTMTFSPSSSFSVDIGLNGAQGIVSAGYDWQLTQRVVAGVLVDYAFGKVDGSFGTERISIDNQFAIGGRLGYLLNPKSLLFATAGWTRAKFEDADFPYLNTSVHGFFVGGGLEQSLSNNLSLKLEYRFSDYNAFRDPIFVDDKYNNDVHSVRLGLNYNFGR